MRFGTVWTAALRTVESLRGWHAEGADPTAGEIRALAAGRFWKRPDGVSILLSLDDLGLTRVDLVMTPVGHRIGSGASIRRIGRFLRALDRALEVEAG